MPTIQRPGLHETKILHSKEMYSTRFSDDVIRFVWALKIRVSVFAFLVLK